MIEKISDDIEIGVDIPGGIEIFSKVGKCDLYLDYWEARDLFAAWYAKLSEDKQREVKDIIANKGG